MNKTRILLIIAIVVSEIFTIIQFRGKGDSAKSYSLLEEQISSETAVVSELSNELETLKSEITSLSGKIDGVDQEIEDLSNRKAELEDLLAKKAEEAKTVEVAIQETKVDEQKVETPEPTPAPQQQTGVVDGVNYDLLNSLGLVSDLPTEQQGTGSGEAMNSLGLTVE